MRYRKILEELLGQKTKIKLLRYLWSEDTAQSGRKIAKEAGINHWQCNKSLKELYSEGILSMQKAGNMYLYSLRRGNYIVDKIISPLFKAEAGTFQELVNELKSLKLQGILSMILFGSVMKTKEKYNNTLHRTIQSGTCFAKKLAKTRHFESPVSSALGA